VFYIHVLTKNNTVHTFRSKHNEALISHVDGAKVGATHLVSSCANLVDDAISRSAEELFAPSSSFVYRLSAPKSISLCFSVAAYLMYRRLINPSSHWRNPSQDAAS
jgi:hypothetical protein